MRTGEVGAKSTRHWFEPTKNGFESRGSECISLKSGEAFTEIKTN